MNAPLEALLLAYDAWQNAGPDDATKAESHFRQLLETTGGDLKLDLGTLHEALRRKYPRWLHAQKKPSALPPKA